MSHVPSVIFLFILSAGLAVGCTGEVSGPTEQQSSITGQTPPITGQTPPHTGEECFTDEQCANQIDDDCDGKTDCEDEDCQGAGICNNTCDAVTEICDNGIDDNCDGQIDENCPGLCVWSAFDCGEAPEEIAHCDGDESCYEEWVALQCNFKVTTTTVDGQTVFVCNDKSECAKFTCHVPPPTPPKPPTPPPPPPPPPPCVWETHDCHDGAFGHCNGHLGDNEAACRAQGNPGGCPGYIFDGWCTRRVNQGPSGAWFLAVKKWVEDRCGGPADLMMDEKGEHLDLYRCQNDNTCKIFQCETPLVLAFDPDRAVTYLPDDGLGAFDLSAAQDGTGQRVDWPTAATPWLALDVDGDGQISSGRELFGSAARLAGGTAHNGFEALGALDHNADGVLDGRDPRFGEILIWADLDGDRRSSAGELRTLADLGVVSLSLAYSLQDRCDDRGNCERERGVFSWHDSEGTLRQGAVIDVNLSTRIPAVVAAAARGFIPAECPTEGQSLLRLLGVAL